MSELSPLLSRLPSLQPSNDYVGEAWVGRSHKSDQPGVVKHSLRWIAPEAAGHGLRTQLTSYPIVNHQYWLRITRA